MSRRIMGSVNVNQSEKYGAGFSPMCKTLLTMPKIAVIEKKPKLLGNVINENSGTGFAGCVWDKKKVCPTITTMQGGGRQPMVIERKK